MISNKNINVSNLYKILEKKYKLKEIVLEKLYEYYPEEYNEGASLLDVSEGYFQNCDTVKIYIGDATSENGFLPKTLRKYNLYILHYDKDKLTGSFYRSEFGEDKEIIDLIESFKCN
ncbi:MAG: hypothetical protein NC184_04495 [Roseburia sp.]|nr:hypothetical protein [Roseburia sp.]